MDEKLLDVEKNMPSSLSTNNAMDDLNKNSEYFLDVFKNVKGCFDVEVKLFKLLKE